MSDDLAKRAVACKHWRWMPGMLVQTAAGQSWRLDECDEWAGQPPGSAFPEWFPDLDDPATLGCLLALVRDAWGDPTLHVWYSRQLGLWIVSANGEEIGVQETTEAEALVAALEAAP